MAQNDLHNAKPTSNPSDQVMSGADIVVETLIRNGVEVVFGYPGGTTIPLHQAFSRRRNEIRVVLPRHEQGAGFAAQGYARATGKVGVCATTSGPGAGNIVTAINDAKLDSVPMLIITGQVNFNAIGQDSFQETPITEVCRCITKHHYLVERTEDLARIVSEALYVASSGRPGPVLLDVPKNVLVGKRQPNFDEKHDLPAAYKRLLSKKDNAATLREVVSKLNSARRPIILSGGGVTLADATELLKKIVAKTNVPVATTMPGLASFPRDDSHSLGMAGMHGTFCANKGIRESDLLLVFGARFSDRVAAVPSRFAPDAFIVHFDVDPSEFNKAKRVDATVCGDLKTTLQELLDELEKSYEPVDLSDWSAQLAKYDAEHPIYYSFTKVEQEEDLPTAQYAISELSKATQDKDAIITTGVGQHQLWTTLYYRFNKPRSWLSSCGLGTMGFGLPSAMGAKVARPEATVVAIEGDGSLQMNIQEMATCITEHIPVKLLLINNQHLGNVMQWEDFFFKKINPETYRANTYLGDIDDKENVGKGDGYHLTSRYPNYPMIARGYGWNAEVVETRSQFPDALKRMLESDRPYMIDVRVPYSEYVLPMIPPGGTLEDVRHIE